MKTRPTKNDNQYPRRRLWNENGTGTEKTHQVGTMRTAGLRAQATDALQT